VLTPLRIVNRIRSSLSCVGWSARVPLTAKLRPERWRCTALQRQTGADQTDDTGSHKGEECSTYDGSRVRSIDFAFAVCAACVRNGGPKSLIALPMAEV
jgi:hypothetical protein